MAEDDQGNVVTLHPSLAKPGDATPWLDLAPLKPWPKNPRRITPERMEQLKRSMLADPRMLDTRPLVALPDGTVIMGNQRLAAARELGWDTIPYVVVDLDADTAATWAFRDNQGYGLWEDDEVAALLASLADAGVDLDLTGFDDTELTRFLQDAAPLPEQADDDAPPLPVEPESRPGELYELGPHRLLCGDATDPDAYATLMGGNIAEVMWTDPPYGVSYVGKTKDAMTIQNDGSEGIDALLGAAFTGADSGRNNLVFRVAMENAGWRFHIGLVWVKNSMVLGHSDYHVQHEDILYGWKAGEGRAGRGNHEGSRWYGDHSQTTVFHIDKPSRSADHPTMKPVELVVAMLRNSAKRGDVILDPFAGSGTTLFAADALGQVARVMEIDPRYCDVIRARWERHANG